MDSNLKEEPLIDCLLSMGYIIDELRPAVSATGVSTKIASRRSVDKVVEYLRHKHHPPSPSINQTNQSQLNNQPQIIQPSSNAAQTAANKKKKVKKSPSNSTIIKLESHLSTSEPRPCSICIVRPSADNVGEFELDVEALERVFGREKYAKMPIALYSLVGAFRMGKSFMLNLFLRYFNSGQSSTWMMNDSDLVKTGFQWRGGVEGVTAGIHIWSEPFVVESKGKKIALFLMDTQGAFDPTRHVGEYSVIFALSSLLSSVQIFNVSRQISAADLQHLKLFTEYGKMAREIDEISSCLPEKALQNLVFLVRDWCDPSTYPYGLQGGDDYIQEKLFNDDGSDDKGDRDVDKEFTKVSCFLLPYPGERVANRNPEAGSLRLSDMSKEFRHKVDELVTLLFSSGGVVPKRVNGKRVTGADFINLTTSYCMVLQSGKMPSVDTISEACAKATLQKAVDGCLEYYIEEMDSELCQMTFVEREKLDELMKEAKEKTLQQFEIFPKFGSERLKRDYCESLERLIVQQDENFKQRNAMRYESMKSVMRDAMETSLTVYREYYKTESNDQYLEEEKQIKLHDTCKQKAVGLFHDAVSGQRNPNMEMQYLEKLHKQIDEDLKQFRIGNKQLKADLLGHLLKITHDAKKIYTNRMEMKLAEGYLVDQEFDDAHAKAEEAAMEIVRTSEVGKGLQIRDKKQKDFNHHVKEEMEKYRRMNEINKKLTEAEMTTVINTVKEKYNTTMAELVCGTVFINANDLSQAHAQSKCNALEYMYLLGCTKGYLFMGKCLSLLEEVFENEREKHASANKLRKESAVNEIDRICSYSLQKYTSQLNEFEGRYLDAEKFELEHQLAKQEAVAFYDENSPREPVEEHKLAKQSLENAVQKQYILAHKRNSVIKQGILDHAKLIKEETKHRYLCYMRENYWKGKYIDPDLLEDEHNKQKRQIHEEMMKVIEDHDLLQDFPIQVAEELDVLYKKSVKIPNENKKKTVHKSCPML